MTHIKTLTSATLKQTAAHGGCGELQDFLHGCKPEVRAQQVI